ncbi:hypothetical protein DPMN_029427 [Dreissena polymorpha]|uniref:Uncharacterized protein n=1 Tax=Dreissena polymorpha TaxID=45954 RepID=A0A9D4LY55_DREPO|nr:hypothetical protein DPMN_029427 [Dreissena polymorpha]
MQFRTSTVRKYAQYINVLGIGSTAGDVKRAIKAAQRALRRKNILSMKQGTV